MSYWRHRTRVRTTTIEDLTQDEVASQLRTLKSVGLTYLPSEADSPEDVEVRSNRDGTMLWTSGKKSSITQRSGFWVIPAPSGSVVVEARYPLSDCPGNRGARMAVRQCGRHRPPKEVSVARAAGCPQRSAVHSALFAKTEYTLYSTPCPAYPLPISNAQTAGQCMSALSK